MIHLLRTRSEKDRTGKVYEGEASTGLDVCAFIGTANLFFCGLVITSLESLPPVVHLSVVYLVVSAVAFIISSVIYANVQGTMHRKQLSAKMIEVGNWVSEYAGVYVFLIAIPLLILGVTNVVLVQIATAITCYGALLLYSSSPYSIDERRFGRGIDRILNTIILSVFCIGLYIVGMFAPQYLLSAGLIGALILLSFSFFSLSFDDVGAKK